MLIYKITNKLNGKLYIGQTVRTPEERKQLNCNYKYATFRRKIIDCINTGRCDYGRGFSKIVVDNIKWFNK